MRVGGDNENDDDDDDDEDEEANDDENDDEDVTPGDNAVPAIPLTTAFADIDSATELPPKKKNKREYEGEKTKNSKPNNPRGGIAATISNLCNGITEGRQVNMMMDFQKQLREQQDRADARMEKMQQQQQQYMQYMMMMMMMMGKGGYPQTGMDCPPSAD